MLRILGIVVPLLASLSVTVPVFSTFFFFFLFANGAMQSPCTFFFHQPIVLWFRQTTAWGMAATLGVTSAFSILTAGICIGEIGQSALALNRFMEVGTELGHGVSSLTWKVGALGIVSGCCLFWGALQLVAGFSSTCGLPVGQGIPSNFPCAKLHTVIGIDVAADFTMGIRVVAVEVATVGVGAAVWIGFTGKVEAGVVGKGWVISLTSYLLFTSALALLFLSAFLGTRVFLIKELLWEGVLMHGCNWGWDWGLGSSLPFNSRYVFIFLIKEG